MWPFPNKPQEVEEEKTFLAVWDDTITAKEVMDLFMWHVSSGGTPAVRCKPSKIPPHLMKFFKERE